MPPSVAGSARETEPAARVPRGRRPLTPDQQALAARYLPLARSLARPLKAAWPDSRDEFESVACLALVQAAESFDPARGFAFATFARYRIAGALRDALRHRVPYGWRDEAEHAPARFSLFPHAEESGRVLVAEPDLPIGSELEAIEAGEGWLRKLPPKHAAALRRIYLHGETHAQAAAVLGLSASRIAFMHREALDLLRESAGR
jgi:RNA polymerase sigma factor (sigma-70 family)